jgi:6-pyruvoyl-tetrahydropterin synthase
VHYRNLDDVPDFARKNTTTEYLARWIFDGLAARLLAGELGSGGEHVASIKVTLHESHMAWASYEGAVER